MCVCLCVSVEEVLMARVMKALPWSRAVEGEGEEEKWCLRASIWGCVGVCVCECVGVCVGGNAYIE